MYEKRVHETPAKHQADRRNLESVLHNERSPLLLTTLRCAVWYVAVTREEFDAHKGALQHAILRRATHFFDECDRVHAGACLSESMQVQSQNASHYGGTNLDKMTQRPNGMLFLSSRAR